MNPVAANAFRTGYNLRSYTGVEVFDFRRDNVQKLVRKIEHKLEIEGVEFNIGFNVNEVAFNSRLNENMF
jgi:hypothetical protein